MIQNFKHMKKSLSIISYFSLLILVLISLAWVSDIYLPINIKNAYDNETRSYDGNPGINYWQNRSDYKIHIDFDPETRLVNGSEEITYFNNSPDELNVLIFKLLFSKQIVKC